MKSPQPGQQAQGSYLREFMGEHRLQVSEVARAAGVSASSIIRLRSVSGGVDGKSPSTRVIRRVADALSHLTQLDSDELFQSLMMSVGREDEVRQVDLGLRGSAELSRHYQRMSKVARHLLLEHARLLARALPDDSEAK